MIVTGSHTIRFDNKGADAHELVLARLDEGKTASDLLQALAPGASGPPPGRILGGIAAIQPGAHGTFTATFEPGKYALICFVPNGATGKAHFELGMVTEFTVQ